LVLDDGWIVAVISRRTDSMQVLLMPGAIQQAVGVEVPTGRVAAAVGHGPEIVRAIFIDIRVP
jgi:hypothetical protein